jgi:hypothetical protein
MEAAGVQAPAEEQQGGVVEGEAIPAGAHPAVVDGAAQSGGVPVAADEAPPPFEGEVVEDSIGWVVTEPAPEFKYDWPVQEAAWPAKWEEEEPEEEEVAKAPKKKKRKKSRPGYGQQDEVTLGSPANPLQFCCCLECRSHSTKVGTVPNAS